MLLILVLLPLFTLFLLLVLNSVRLGVSVRDILRVILVLHAPDLVLVVSLARRVEPRGGKRLMLFLCRRCLDRLDRVRLDSLDVLRRRLVEVVVLAWNVCCRRLAQGRRRCDSWDVTSVIVTFVLHGLGDYGTPSKQHKDSL